MARIIFFLSISTLCFSQGNFPNEQAHAHNDYEHDRPLFDALQFGFISVEADVHLVNGDLRVSHGRPKKDAYTLQQLYLAPLDSLIEKYNSVYPGYTGTFYLMIDCKTEAYTHTLQFSKQ